MDGLSQIMCLFLSCLFDLFTFVYSSLFESLLFLNTVFHVFFFSLNILLLEFYFAYRYGNIREYVRRVVGVFLVYIPLSFAFLYCLYMLLFRLNIIFKKSTIFRIDFMFILHPSVAKASIICFLIFYCGSAVAISYNV